MRRGGIIKYQIGSIIGFDGMVQFRVSDLKNTGKMCHSAE